MTHSRVLTYNIEVPILLVLIIITIRAVQDYNATNVYPHNYILHR